MSNPLVSVICLCYNHERFVKASIRSVIEQTYPNIEIIVVDDHSTDSSVREIENLQIEYPQIKFYPLNENVGNCKAFNIGLANSTGDFIIDLASDDLLLADRVSKGVIALNNAGELYGVNFCNAAIINDESIILNHFYPIDQNGRANATVPQGDLYVDLIKKYFICSPTMLIRREVFTKLNGYDEELAYEDFDFWVRSARDFNYCFTDEVLVQKRKLKGSMSERQYQRKSEQMRSTLVVCKKIMDMNRTKSEKKALRKRIYYEMRQCIKVMDTRLFFDYLKLLLKNS
ncbi:MAG TPA: glycosyltransferase [Fulvivirga sp.]|nr:glycosyltransferase [Fulvivirga sp.]